MMKMKMRTILKPVNILLVSFIQISPRPIQFICLHICNILYFIVFSEYLNNDDDTICVQSIVFAAVIGKNLVNRLPYLPVYNTAF